jgi:hypothetical protein
MQSMTVFSSFKVTFRRFQILNYGTDPKAEGAKLAAVDTDVGLGAVKSGAQRGIPYSGFPGHSYATHYSY